MKRTRIFVLSAFISAVAASAPQETSGGSGASDLGYVRPALLSLPLRSQDSGLHSRTKWELKPSLKYDAICLLNALSGDPYYLTYYRAEYEHFHPLFKPEENAAFAQLKHVIKDEGGSIVSAKLALYYSVMDDESLPQMIRTALDSHIMRSRLKQTAYWDDAGWENYERGRPALETALRALDRVGFTKYWEEVAKPQVKQSIARLSPDLPKYNIVPAIERHLGHPLASETITVYVLSYSEPHGIRITGLRFLTHRSYPFRIVLHNAIHEPMHPPYDLKDPRIRAAVELLGRDPLVVDKVEHHDRSFGYNTAAGLIDEDSVEALEQIISEQFGVGRDAQKYWKNQDGGLHILATAIYTHYKADLRGGAIAYPEWFVRAVQNGQLRGDNLRATIDSFFAEKSALPSGTQSHPR